MGSGGGSVDASSEDGAAGSEIGSLAVSSALSGIGVRAGSGSEVAGVASSIAAGVGSEDG